MADRGTLVSIRDAAIGAIVVSILGVAGNWVTGGGVIKALGGVTDSDFKQVRPTPPGAVVGFDLRDGCPEGWTRFDDGAGRVIVGAGKGKDLEEERPYRVPGGREFVKLDVKNLPPHRHGVIPRGSGKREHPTGTGVRPEVFELEPGSQLSESTGDGERFSVMPPYLPLVLCRKQ
jgi:hypothetical protein